MTEFHAPQASQRPCHLRWTAPQAVQVNCGEGERAMPALLPDPAPVRNALRRFAPVLDP
jgi:hypothetical protein